MLNEKMNIYFITLILFSFYHSDAILDGEELVGKAIFPPEVTGEPPGHNKPLGSQRQPEGHVKEYNQPLSALSFWKYHVEPRIPLVIRGYIKNSSAITNWKSDDYLSEHYGDLDVLVEHKLEDRTSSSGRMKLSDFLKNYKNQDMYVVSMFPSEMMNEVRAIPSILCGTFQEYTHESNLWISNGGTRSVVHYDADHNIHCVLDGRKDFIMINNNITTKSNLYFKYKNPGVGSAFSFLDPDKIDMHKFPKIAKVPWTWASLYPGDCIFIPSVYIHQVRGYGRTIAVTTLFTADHKGTFDDQDCTDELLNTYHTMADINFQWTYKKGDSTIDMGYMNVNLVKEQIKHSLKDPDFTITNSFTRKQFIYFSGILSPVARNLQKIASIWDNVFKFSADDLITEETIDSLSLEQWKIYCRAIEKPHGVVTNGSEPVFVKPGERHKWEAKEEEDDDTDDYMTEDERALLETANRDPMLEHLNTEEREEYIKTKQLEKAKYGVGYDPAEIGADIEDIAWKSQLSFKIDDIPKKYHAEIEKGRIPEEIKAEFIESLPDLLVENHRDLLTQGRIPKSLYKALYAQSFTSMSYLKKIQKHLDTAGNEYDSEENDAEADEENDEEHLIISMADIDAERQREFLSGKIDKGDAKILIEYLPKRFYIYKTDLLNGVLPREILMSLLRSDEQNFNEDFQYWADKSGYYYQKDEL